MDKLRELFSDTEFVKRLAVVVAGLAAVFGAQWTPEGVADWLQTVIEAVGVLLTAGGTVWAGLRVKDKTGEGDTTE